MTLTWNHPRYKDTRDVMLALDLPEFDDRISVYVTKSECDWAYAHCDITDKPAAFVVDYAVLDDDGYTLTEASFAGDIAGDEIRALLNSEKVSESEEFRITASYWWLRYAAVSVPA